MKHTFSAAFTALLLLILTACGTTAAPTKESTKKPFSFASWVDDLSRPDIVALTPEQALEAYNASRHSAVSKREGAGGVSKRWPEGLGMCFPSDMHAPADDAVAIIALFVEKGQEKVTLRQDPSGFRNVIGVHGQLTVDAYCYRGGRNQWMCPERTVT